MPLLEGPPTPDTLVWRRDTTIGADAARNPWIARCDMRTCFWTLSAITEGDAWTKLEEHQMGDLCPTPLVNYENKQRVRSPLEGGT